MSARQRNSENREKENAYDVFVLHTAPAVRLIITGVELYDAQNPTPAGLAASQHPFGVRLMEESLKRGVQYLP